MPAWPGGPCPSCGEDVPENLIRCFNCRTLLNADLVADSVEIPAFVPLQELDVLVDVVPVGYFVGCPQCDKELRISKKYVGQKVICKHCDGSFLLELAPQGQVEMLAFYAPCPACQQELRASSKYFGKKVVCKHCSGHLNFVES